MSPHGEHNGPDERPGKNTSNSNTLLTNVLEKSAKGGADSTSGVVAGARVDFQAAPATPTGKGTVYSTNGTPIGLSRTFQSSPYGGYAGHSLAAWGAGTMASFPATSRLSPQVPDPYMQVALGSRRPPDHSMESLGSRGSAAAGGIFGDGSSLLETDLEAVSALNILSNSSSASFSSKRKAPSADEEEEGKTRAKPKSLFAKVVGGGMKHKKRKT